MSEHKTCKRTDCRWCGADGHPFCSDFCGLRWYRQHGDDSIDEHDGCEGPGAAEIVRQGPSSYPELSRIAEICRDVRKEGTAMQAALSAADALAALEVYRQAVLKSIGVLNLARAPGPPGGALCVCDAITDILNDAHLKKIVRPYEGGARYPNPPREEKTGDG